MTREQLRLWLLASIITFTTYLLVGQVSGYIYKNIGTSPVAVMTPAGVALAAVLIEGYAMLPAIFLAAFANGFLSNSPGILIAGSVIGNTLQPFLILFFLRRFDFSRRLASVKDVFLMLGAALFGSMVVPTFQMAATYLYNLQTVMARETYWVTWWMAGSISVLAGTTFLIRWIKTSIKKKTQEELLEMSLAIALMCIATFFIFWTPYATISGFSLAYPQLALLLWISLRARPRFMTLAILLETVISISGALLGTHSPPSVDISKTLYTTEVYDLIFITVFFIIFSLEDQRKRITETLREHSERLETALSRIRNEEQAKNEFIATLAHELRNPLAALLTSVELLDVRATKEEEPARLRQSMFNKIRSMSRLLDDLLDIARITKKQFLLRKEKAELNPVIQRAVENSMHHIKERRQSLSVSMPVDTVYLSADPLRLEQAFGNLITNASKYTPAGGHIEVTGRYQEGWASVAITDTGIGIPDDMLTRIFEPFVQIKPPGKNSDGLGIGLALSKSLVELHGGSIVAKRRDGARGSEFIVMLPSIGTSHPRANEPKAVKRTAASPIPNAFKILVVDDNAEAAQSLGKLLSFRGHDVSIAYDGKEALHRIPEEDPEVVLLDIGLPDMDGYEVARELRRSEHSPVLIALTGYGQADDQARAREAGFDYHLTKPAGLAEIEGVLRNIRVAA